MSRVVLLIHLVYSAYAAEGSLKPLENLESCLQPQAVPQRYLQYPDGTSHPVYIPYVTWASAQITSQIAHILLQEAMGYSATLLSGVALSNQPVNLAAGCADMNDPLCKVRDPDHPTVHFTVETWLYGINWANALPQEIRPVVTRDYDYQSMVGNYVWQEVLDAGLASSVPTALDYYVSYNAAYFKPFRFFDTWQEMLRKIPRDIIVLCSERTSVNMDGDLSDYIKATKDTDTSCSYNDTIWFSPACRSNTTECVPLLMQYDYAQSMQQAFFLNMPIALVLIKSGSAEYDQAYYNTIREGRYLFGWFSPDDSLVDSQGKLPSPLNLPATNQLEQEQNIFKTGNSYVQLRNYAWPSLAKVSRHVNYFVTKMDFFQADIDSMMIESKATKDRGYDNVSASRMVACNWIKSNEARWSQWLPAMCPNGSYSDSLVQCSPCPAGQYCLGGVAEAVPCPLGFYCPANASSPIQCGGNKFTEKTGAVSEDNCTECISGYLVIQGSCGSVLVTVVCIVVPLLCLAGLAALLGFWCGHSKVSPTDSDDELHSKVQELCQRFGISRSFSKSLAIDTPLIPPKGMRRRLSALLGHPVLHMAEIEAAARLTLFRENVDLKLVDMFCSCLSQPSRIQNLKGWILEMSATLIDPSEKTGQCDSPQLKKRYSGTEHSIETPPWISTASQAERFEYFTGKLCRLEVWKNEQDLLEGLKGIAAKYMDQVAGWCDERFQAVLSETDGMKLKSYGAKQEVGLCGSKAIATHSNLLAIPNISCDEVLQNLSDHHPRQDFPEVGAIRISDVDRTEALQQCSDGKIFPGLVDEEVFLAQLLNRSKLLNQQFQDKVVEVVQLNHNSAGPMLTNIQPAQYSIDNPGLQTLLAFNMLEVLSAPPKNLDRMREKLRKYSPPHPRAIWPFSANILDPIRCSLVCPGPSAMLQVAQWFADYKGEDLRIVRVKNKFSLSPSDLVYGYRDIQLSVIFTGKHDIKIIAEVQVHDAELYRLKMKMHKLYKVMRCTAISSL